MLTGNVSSADEGLPATSAAGIEIADPAPDPGAVRGARTTTSRTTASRITTAGIVLVLVLLGILAVHRQWISDDGMIVVREVREILAGSGPNFNPLQRDEVDTSALWTWLMVACAFVRGGDVAIDAIWLGFTLTIAGLGLALLGCRTLHRQLGATGVLAPVGALVPVAVSGFWDFATSGLETGLIVFYLGGAWWLLVAVTIDTRAARLVTFSVIVGLGPLVRPEFAVVSVVFFAAMVGIARPGWRPAVAYAAAGALAPLSYQVFRMGYYGIAVPMPALAKEAGSALWTRGTLFLADFTNAYLLWVPATVIVVVAAQWLRHKVIDRRTVILLSSPVLVGLLLGAYVMRVGGDYMHARMWLAATFALLLPVLLLPVGRGHRATTLGATLVAVWALVAGLSLRPPYHGHQFSPTGVVDERSYESVTYLDDPDLSTTASRTRDHARVVDLFEHPDVGRHTVIVSSGPDANGPPWRLPTSPSVPDDTVFFYDDMGIAAAVVPLDDTVADLHGLATPLAGHLLVGQRTRPGHEKLLTAAWVLAEYADPAATSTMPDTADATRAQVRAARHALSCGALADLVASVDQPMSWNRFWANLTGAWGRTELRVPVDPFDAERTFC